MLKVKKNVIFETGNPRPRLSTNFDGEVCFVFGLENSELLDLVPLLEGHACLAHHGTV